MRWRKEPLWWWFYRCVIILARSLLYQRVSASESPLPIAEPCFRRDDVGTTAEQIQSLLAAAKANSLAARSPYNLGGYSLYTSSISMYDVAPDESWHFVHDGEGLESMEQSCSLCLCVSPSFAIHRHIFRQTLLVLIFSTLISCAPLRSAIAFVNSWYIQRGDARRFVVSTQSSLVSMVIKLPWIFQVIMTCLIALVFCVRRLEKWSL